ncbi:flotillin family protein [Fodinicurvata fenggangensis]|uniref:flotillin family protein n=1 Tax=Fodinicurvata fenggangensis TaxID=1121830 RepID=UPI00047A0CCD|nr:flotillin domain-containing protein [Fodinicurvata fenggangensis]
MSGAALGWTVLGIIVLIAVIVGVVYLLNWLYRRSTKETAFVRTGLGGEKVVKDGGAFVLPIVHEVIPVNMNTLRLEIKRGQDRALITKNRMRVDVVTEFYVRVQPTREAIAIAAQSLGRRTMNPEALKELVEGKFIDALRWVAAEMTMEELHEKRGEYVKRVKTAVAEDLQRSGLELEALSLTGMDQTNMEYFNPSNAFDAEGLTRLTEEIERRKKLRNDIEQDTMIEIRNKNLETERYSLQIDRDTEYARLEQQRDIESRKAEQQAEVARERAQRERESEESQISSRLEIERARIASDRALDEERINREQGTQRLEIDRRKALELAEQDKAIELAEKSKAQSEAQAAAELARAKAVEAEEKVFTAREKEQAERRKAIELVLAAQEAEREGIRLRSAAEAEKQASTDRAEATRTTAEGEAEAEKIRALAAKLRYETEAEGKRQMNEAQNVLTPESRQSQMRMHLIDKMDGIIRESVKPMEKIEGIKVLQLDGFGGFPGGAGGSGGGGEGHNGLPDNLVNSALRYRAQGPLVDSLLKEIGMEGGDINKLVGGVTDEEDDDSSDKEKR